MEILPVIRRKIGQLIHSGLREAHAGLCYSLMWGGCAGGVVKSFNGGMIKGCAGEVV